MNAKTYPFPHAVNEAADRLYEALRQYAEYCRESMEYCRDAMDFESAAVWHDEMKDAEQRMKQIDELRLHKDKTS